MRYLAPFAVHAALRIASDDDVAQRREDYRRLIVALRDDRLDLDRAAAGENLAEELETMMAPREVA
jgi:glutathione-regulated potassium-efflux system ancillary protein KefG